MAWPTTPTLDDALKSVNVEAVTIKRTAQSAVTSMAAGPVTASYVLNLLALLKRSKAVLSAAAALPGIAAYAEAEFGDAVGDVAAEFTAMMNAIDAAGGWIITNFPKSNGYLLAESMNAQGDRTERTFDAATTAPLRTLLTNLIATIN